MGMFSFFFQSPNTYSSNPLKPLKPSHPLHIGDVFHTNRYDDNDTESDYYGDYGDYGDEPCEKIITGRVKEWKRGLKEDKGWGKLEGKWWSKFGGKFGGKWGWKSLYFIYMACGLYLFSLELVQLFRTLQVHYRYPFDSFRSFDSFDSFHSFYKSNNRNNIQTPIDPNNLNDPKNLKNLKNHKNLDDFNKQLSLFFPPMPSFWFSSLRKDEEHDYDNDPEIQPDFSFRQTDFESIGGYENVKKELEQLVDYIQDPQRYLEWNIRMPKGCLLYGPPGTGKTLFARSLVGEVLRRRTTKQRNTMNTMNTSSFPPPTYSAGYYHENKNRNDDGNDGNNGDDGDNGDDEKKDTKEMPKITFLISSGSEFVEKYVGVGAQRIRSLFQYARNHAPAIIYIDEIDGIGKHRSSGDNGGSSERDTTLNQLLVEMDGFVSDRLVFVIASTNRMDTLDPALLRSGRLDKKIHIPLPNFESRKKILALHSQGKPMSPTMEWNQVAKTLTKGLSGADIENLLNEASLEAIRSFSLPVTFSMLEKTHQRMFVWGTFGEDIQLRLHNTTLYQIAVHEMGHLITSWGCPAHPPAILVTIENPSLTTLGYTSFLEETEEEDKENPPKVLWSLTEFLERIRVYYGGRIAEEMVFGEEHVSTGAVGDFQRIREIATKMVTYYGMNPSNVSYLYSEETSRHNDPLSSSQTYEIEVILQTQREWVRAFLLSKFHILPVLSQELLEKKKVSREGIQQWRRKFNI